MTLAELESGERRERAAFASGAVAGFVGRGAGFGLQYLFLAGVGRLLGAELSASVYAMLAAATTLAAFGRAGLDRFGMREIATSIAQKRSGVVRPLIGRLIAIQVACGALIVTLVYVFREQLGNLLSVGPGSFVAQLCALVIGLMLTISLSEYVLAHREVVAAAMVKMIIPYGIGSVILVALRLNGTVVDRGHVVGSLIAGLATAAMVAIAWLWQTTSPADLSENRLPALVLSRSLALAAVPLLMMGMTGLDIVLLQAAQPGEQTAFYQAAQRTAMTLTLGLLAINGIAAPMIADAFSGGRMDELGRIVRRASRWSLQQATVIAVFLILTGRWVLELFGSEFALGYIMLMILVVAQLINAGAGPVVQLFVMTGNESAVFAVLASVVTIALPAFYFAGQAAGGTGVAIVTAAAFALWNGGLLVVARRRFGIWSYADNWLGNGALLIGATALAYVVTDGRLSVWGIAYLAATAVGGWFLCLGNEDREMLLDAVAATEPQGGMRA